MPRVRLLSFKLGLGGSHLYIRRGGVSLEGKQEVSFLPAVGSYLRSGDPQICPLDLES
jgi:hypothetical protein